VDLARYADAVAETVRLTPGQSRTLELSPVFADSIMQLTEERMTNVTLKVEKTDGGVVVEKTIPVRLLSRNDMVWSGEQTFDLMFLIAVFVTPRPSDKSIDRLLREAADRTPFGSIIGYQEATVDRIEKTSRYTLGHRVKKRLSHKEIVEAQAKAIFDTIKARGVKYVNAPVSFGRDAQRIKYADEVLADRSGNCIETTVLFASAIEATGMHPTIIIVPNHAFVGVQEWKWGSGPEAAGMVFIETTMVGSRTFEEARDAAERQFLKAYQEGKAQLIPIYMLSQFGIAPAPK
ncbi:MAG: hypothetical protein ACYS9X_30945, partial [Planctomycetota bacterium]